MRRTILISASFVCLVCIAGASGQVVQYVDASAADGGDGQSWGTAFDDLQEALDAARVIGGVQEIWVAQGRYVPDRGTGGRNLSFRLISDVEVLGGFQGIETDRSDADPVAFPTVLSGDLLGDDVGLAGMDENSRHVVVASGITQAALDGFIVERGRDDDVTFWTDGGAGLQVRGADLAVRRCVFRHHWAGTSDQGVSGGATNVGGVSHVVLEDCLFESNLAAFGGALSAKDAVRLEVDGCLFRENGGHVGSNGGAAHLSDGRFSIRECRFESNVVPSGASGAAAVFFAQELDILGTDFVDNHADYRAGALWIGNSDGSLSRPAKIEDCQFVQNRAAHDAGGLYVEYTITHLNRCRFLGNRVTVGGVGGALLKDRDGHRIEQCVFSGNASSSTSALRLELAQVHVRFCTVAHNFAWSAVGTALSMSQGTTQIDHTIFFRNRADGSGGEDAQLKGHDVQIDYCLVEGWSGERGGEGNFDGLPRFVDADGPDDTPGTEDDDLRIRRRSDALDAGNPAEAPLGRDAWGDPRFLDGNLDGSFLVDIGADERNASHLEIAGRFAPSETLQLTTEGESGLTQFLFVATERGDVFLPGIGALHADLGHLILIQAIGPSPSDFPFTLPPSLPSDLELVVQVVALGSISNTTSNAVDLGLDG